MGKKALLALHFIALLPSQKLIWIFSIFTSSKFGSLTSRDEISQKIFGILTSGFGHNKITSNELETPKLTKRIEIHQLQITNNECSSLLECSPNFPSAQYLDIRTAAAWTNCFITLSTRHLILKEAKLSLLLLDASFIFCLRNTLRYPSTIHFLYFN